MSRHNLAPLYEAADIIETDRDARARLAVACGVSRRTIERWHAAGSLSAASADKAAIGLRLHPLLIWPHWGTATREAAA